MTGPQTDTEAEIIELARDVQRRTRPGAHSLFDRLLESAMEDKELEADPHAAETFCVLTKLKSAFYISSCNISRRSTV